MNEKIILLYIIVLRNVKCNVTRNFYGISFATPVTKQLYQRFRFSLANMQHMCAYNDKID